MPLDGALASFEETKTVLMYVRILLESSTAYSAYRWQEYADAQWLQILQEKK